MKKDCFIFVENPSTSTITIKNWAETRWDSRWTSIQSIIHNYKLLIHSLEELAVKGTERLTDARGLLLGLKGPLFIVVLFILHSLLGKIKILSDQLKCRIFSLARHDHQLYLLASIFLAKSLDFGTAHTLISAVINQISELRNEDDFSKLYDKINEFAVANNIDLNVPMRARRAMKATSRFKNCSITTTIGQREEIDDKSKYRISIFYPVIDSILLEMNDRFSKTNVEILRAISSLSPDSSTFLEIEELKPLCMMLKCDIQLLNNEIEVLTPMLKQLKPKTVVDLYL